MGPWIHRQPTASILKEWMNSFSWCFIITDVFCLASAQAPTAQNPTRQQGGQTEGDSVNYASLHFRNKPTWEFMLCMQYQNKKSIYGTFYVDICFSRNKHEADAVYEKVSKPTKTKKVRNQGLSFHLSSQVCTIIVSKTLYMNTIL